MYIFRSPSQARLEHPHGWLPLEVPAAQRSLFERQSKHRQLVHAQALKKLVTKRHERHTLDRALPTVPNLGFPRQNGVELSPLLVPVSFSIGFF